MQEISLYELSLYPFFYPFLPTILQEIPSLNHVQNMFPVSPESAILIQVQN